MADAHFCSSQLSVNELKAAGEVEGRIYFVPPTIDGYAPEPTVDAAAPRVSYLGNLTEERFPLSTLKRVIEIIEERKGIFELVTSTRAVNDAHVAAVEGLQSESVRIVRRNLSREEKQALFARTNIFLLPFSTPSAIDPPVTLLEAMGAGNLVVATDVQGVQYVVDDGRTGFVVEPNANAVASGLRRALDSLPNAQMRGDARSSVRARFERLRVIESATRAYESIISEAKP